jgi:hypothetical protein
MEASVVMTRLNRPWFLLGVALLVAYLIARPRVGTVVQMYTTTDIADHSKSRLTRSYSTYYECSQDADMANRWNSTSTFTYCREETGMRWGW